MAERKVDHASLKVNQVFIIALLVVAYVIDSSWLVVFVAVTMLTGTAAPSLSIFKRVYKHILKPVGIVKPRVIIDNPEPHRFAQGFGGVVLLVAIAFLFGGAPVVGWVFVGIVVLLAALNLFLGFCAGCFVYYQLHKLGVPGFTRSPIEQGG